MDSQAIIEPHTEANTMNRKRETSPDLNTADGLFALHLAYLMRRKGVNADTLAKSIEVGRATVFGWLRGESSPQIRLWPGIAAALELNDWRKLIPPKSFTGESS